jgi:hypothetical protein
MPLFPVLIFAALAAQQGGSSADANEWGQAVNGVQMSVALVSQSGHDPLIRIVVKNAGDKPLFLPLGEMIGSKFSTRKVSVFVSTTQGQFKFLLSPGVVFVAGRIDPIAIPLLPNSSYTLQTPVTELFRGDGAAGEMELPRLVRGAGRLWVEWDGSPPPQPSGAAAEHYSQMHPANCPLYGAPNPNTIPCWESKVVSNTLQWPR